MNKEIFFVTNSPGKVNEAREILGKAFTLKLVKLDLDEIQTVDGKKVVSKKVKEAFGVLKQPVLVEDTSLYFEAWNGLPGALARWFLDTVGCKGICKMMARERNRKAYAESAIAFYDGKKIKMVSARAKGIVPREPRGEHGFGWDPIFIPKGFEKAYAEMTMKEKNQISMRKAALEKLKKYLVRNL